MGSKGWGGSKGGKGEWGGEGEQGGKGSEGGWPKAGQGWPKAMANALGGSQVEQANWGKRWGGEREWSWVKGSEGEWNILYTRL